MVLVSASLAGLWASPTAMAACSPAISSVSAITTAQSQTVTITGTCFGSQTPYSEQDSPYLRIADNTAGWSACRATSTNTDAILCSVSSWSDSQIVVSSFDPTASGYSLTVGDTVAVGVWNAQTGAGPATQDVSVSATSAQNPTISSFTASSTSLASGGGTVQFGWSGQNVDTWCLVYPGSLDGGPIVCTGVGTGYPVAIPANNASSPASYDFTLAAHGAAGTTTAFRSLTVTVAQSGQNPTISSFAASPNSVPASGGQVTLSWTALNATTCTVASNPSMNGLPTDVDCANLSPSYTVNLPANPASSAVTYVFTLTATGASGTTPASAKASVQVGGVASPPPGSGTMSVTPGTVNAGAADVTLTFTYTAASGGVQGGAVALVIPNGWMLPSVGAAAGYAQVTASQGSVSAGGSSVAVRGVTLLSGQTLTITYGADGAPATAPLPGTYAFSASEASNGSQAFANLSSSPAITVQSGTVTYGWGGNAPFSSTTASTVGVDTLTGAINTDCPSSSVGTTTTAVCGALAGSALTANTADPTAGWALAGGVATDYAAVASEESLNLSVPNTVPKGEQEQIQLNITAYIGSVGGAVSLFQAGAAPSYLYISGPWGTKVIKTAGILGTLSFPTPTIPAVGTLLSAAQALYNADGVVTKALANPPSVSACTDIAAGGVAAAMVALSSSSAVAGMIPGFSCTEETYSKIFSVASGAGPLELSIAPVVMPVGFGVLGSIYGVSFALVTASVTYGGVSSIAGATPPSVSLDVPTVSGLTATVNGAASPAGSGGSITGIDWKWGDGSSGSGDFPQSHTYARGGTYTIVVTATDSNGAVDSVDTTVTVSAPPLVIATTAPLPAAVVGVGYSASLVARRGTGPYTWSVVGGSLPAGLSLDASTGVIGGTPTAAGTSSFTVQVADSSSPAQTATANLSITVSSVPMALSITTTALPGGTVGTAYTATLAAAGGMAPYTWSVSSGSLPAGLSLDASTGVVGGTPTAAGTSNFTVQVAEASSPARAATANLSITVSPMTLAGPYVGTLADYATPIPSGFFEVNSLFPWLLTNSYACSAQGNGGNDQAPNNSCAGSYYLLLGGSSPQAVQLRTYATSAGGTTYAVNSASNGSDPGIVAGVTYLTAGDVAAYTVADGKISNVTEENVNDQIGFVTSTWCDAGCDHTIMAGATPRMQINISGIDYLVNVQTYTTLTVNGATDSFSKSLDGDVAYVSTAGGYGQSDGPADPGTGDGNATTVSLYDNQVTGIVSAVDTGAAAPDVGGDNPQQITAITLTLSKTSETYTVDANFNANGITPTVGSTVTLVLDASGQVTYLANAPTASSVVVITTFRLPSATSGIPYTTTLAATGGTTPYTWSVTTGSLPAGLTLDASTGAISGTPTVAGTSAFTVQVADSSSPAQTATANLSITVSPAEPAALSVTTTSLPGGTVGTTYTTTVAATGGTTPYTWSVTTGSLPAGLSLDASTGVVRGTPTVAGTSNFTVQVADSSSPTQTATTGLSITVTAGAQDSVTVQVGSATIAPGGTGTVPITTGDIHAPGLAGYQLTLTYDPQLLAVTAVQGAGPWQPTADISASGSVRLSAAASTGTTGAQTLAELTVKALGPVGTSAGLSLTRVALTGVDLNAISAQGANGTVMIGGLQAVASLAPATSTGDGGQAGLVVAIPQILNASTGQAASGEAVAGFQLTLTAADPSAVHFLGVYCPSAFAACASHIDPSAGTVTVSAANTQGAAPPAELAFVALRVTGPVTATESVHLTFQSIVDQHDTALGTPDTVTVTLQRGAVFNACVNGVPASGAQTLAVSDAVAALQYLVGLRDAGTGCGQVNPVNLASLVPDAVSGMSTPGVANVVALLQYLVGLRGPNLNLR